MLELLKDGAPINTVLEGGKFNLLDGSVVSPAYAGWKNSDGYELVPYDPPEPVPVPPTEEEVRAARAAAYRDEADPIFFQYQRGEATEQEWLDKIEEIRARYPYPDTAE
jgi:hypothetical protein